MNDGAGLKKALDRRPAYEPTQDEIDVAIAWLEGRISLVQVTAGYGCNISGTSRRIARALRYAYNNGQLKVVKHD